MEKIEIKLKLAVNDVAVAAEYVQKTRADRNKVIYEAYHEHDMSTVDINKITGINTSTIGNIVKNRLV